MADQKAKTIRPIYGVATPPEHITDLDAHARQYASLEGLARGDVAHGYNVLPSAEELFQKGQVDPRYNVLP